MVPAFNEEERLEGTIRNLVECAKIAGNIALDIIIVNDASTDKTAVVTDRLEKKYPSVRSIHHTVNGGIGVGVREAIAAAKFSKFSIIPGDNVVSPDLITKMFLHSGDADVIVTYFLNREIRTPLRIILSDLYGLIYMTTFGVYVLYLNSVCIYPTKKLRQLTLLSSRFSIPAELTIKLLRMGSSYIELSGFYMKEGTKKSTSFSLKNLLEVIIIYIRLIYEIYGEKRSFFAHKPRRIIKDF